MLAYFSITLDVSEQQQDRSSRCCKKAVSHTLVSHDQVCPDILLSHRYKTFKSRCCKGTERNCDLRTSSDCYRKRVVLELADRFLKVLLYFVSDTCVRHTKHRHGAT